MTRRPRPFGPAIAMGFVLSLLGACGAQERARLRNDLALEQRRNERLTESARTLAEQAAEDRRLLLDSRARAEQASAALARAEELQRTLEAVQAKVAALERESAAAAEKQREEIERLSSHRDELREWIDQELLPVAEEKDPRLANLRDAARDMAVEVERIRGLPFKAPFMRRLVARSKIGEWMRRDMKKDMPEDEVRKLTDVGAELGLLAPGTDLYEVFAQFLETGGAAFYRPDTATFYHVEGNDGRGARPIVFHELVHAVEDQYFHLEDFYRAVEDDNDAALARRGLVEGSACHFASKYEAANPQDVEAMDKSQATPEMQQRNQKMVTTVPPFLVASFGLYPYRNAPRWLAAIGAETPAHMESLYRDPPVSTEQVLHPEKFPLSGPRDYPHGIALPDVGPVLGAGFERVHEDNLGELMTGLLLAQIGAPSYAMTYPSIVDPTTTLAFQGSVKRAVEGWDGDRYSAWRDKASGRTTLLWVSVWDAEKDAEEFAATYADLLGKRVTGRTVKPRPSPVRFTERETGRVSGLERSGKRVVAVLGAPADKVDPLFAAGAAAKVTPDPRDPNDR